MKLWVIAVIIALVFVLTYDPNSGTLDKYIVGDKSVLDPQEMATCNNPAYMANNPRQCEEAHYASAQFGTVPMATPPRVPKTEMGVIVG